jgi:hypothetical protein
VALAVVIFARKLWRYGKPLGQATGMVLVAPGLRILIPQVAFPG